MQLGITGVLTVVFITLKLTEVIDWSWWIVLCPIPVALILFLIVLVIYLVIIKKQKDKN